MTEAVPDRHTTRLLGAPDMRIDPARLFRSLDALRQIGATEDGGVNRPAFSAADRLGRQLVLGMMKDAGLVTEVDAAGNLIGRTLNAEPGARWLVTGSHVDSVPNGGGLDGAYGVIAAIEVVRTLVENDVPLPCPVAVVAFSNEEGTPGAPTMIGSHAFSGLVSAGDIKEYELDTSGPAPFSEMLASVGGDLARLRDTAWPAGSIAAYLELHIEQGPVLDHGGIPIGVVEAITGRITVDIHVHGATNHAGTTPMDLRRDALVVAARLILAIESLAGKDGAVRVATVGRCEISPNAWNVVPGEVRLRADVRDISTEAMFRAVRLIHEHVVRIADETDTVITTDVNQVVVPTDCASELRALITSACVELGLDHLTLPSGAGHDAQVVGRVAPVGMIFVPSIGGISHAPQEDTAPEDLVRGTEVLLRTVLGYERSRS